MRVFGFQRRLRTDHATLSHAKAFKTTRRESIGTTIRKRRLFFAGAVARQSKEQLPSRVMFRTTAGGENPSHGRQCKTCNRCIVEDLREFRPTEGSTENSPVMLGVETALWSTATKKAGKWYRGVLEVAERFMVRWHEDEAQLSGKRRESAVGAAQGNNGGMGAT